MAKDITLMGAELLGVPAIDIPQVGSGMARFYDYDFRGMDVEFLETIYPATTVALANTDFATWTPSNTAATIQATSSLTARTLDMATYEYLVRWQFQFQAAYASGATLKNQTYRSCAEIWQYAFKRTNSVANLSTETRTYNSFVTLYTAPLHVYYGGTTGTLTYTHSISYGIYPSVQSPTWSNSTSNSPKLTIKLPAINARCNNTQFLTTRAAEIDQDNSKYILKGELYRLKSPSVIRSMTESLYDLYNITLT